MPSIIHIETLVPKYSFTQQDIAELMVPLFKGRKTHQYIHGISANSAIEKRHSVISDFRPEAQKFFKKENSKITEPGTKERNDIYTVKSKELIAELCLKLKSSLSEFDFQEITHVITVSCTGSYNPGPDIDVVNSLGLAANTERYNLGFMGCYAAFPALKMANQFCEANSEAKVLIVCLELCSLHFQLKENLDNIMANFLFADGVAAAIVSNAGTNNGRLEMTGFNSMLLPEGINDMAWTIGDHAFDMVLSKYVPQIIEANLDKIIHLPENITYWAIHPGGKAILDKVEKSLNIDSSKIRYSREVLKNYGNMSSATILFVLQKILQGNGDVGNVFAMAFGPGLVVETALLRYINSNEK